MSSPAIQSVEDVIEEEFQKEKPKQLKSPPRLWIKLEAFLKKELEFLGVIQTMIGLICFSFGVTHEFILSFLQYEDDFSTFYKRYPIWGGLLFTISGSLLIASERTNINYLAQSSLVMAILSAVTAGYGIRILWDNLKQTSPLLPNCKKQPYEDFCFAASFLTETTVIILFLTILELSIGLLLTVGKIIGKIVERWIAKHRKDYHEALYEELPMYYPISEYVELQSREIYSDPKETRTESRESLHSGLSPSPEELQKT
ncbi:high affinity immunoglobulin epsilon receptor subunit beta-like [Macrotis lagotis]|uniref:high affinity immunoglobulin epsilon receptor subunit beta-like n=1 Tax=Macrotis lagotis TaxID=92651 RepID=UPI003D699C0E